MALTELPNAYVAGFLDGEGCIRISKSHRAKCHPTWSKRYDLVVIVINTCLEVLVCCQKQFGGSICKRKHLFKHLPTYGWYLGAEQSIGLLKAVLPYLIVKQRQAELALEFMEIRTLSLKGRAGKVDERELFLRESYYLRMKQLNTRAA